MPIIAGRASAAYGAGFSRVVTTAYALTGSYYSLGTITLSATTSIVSFSVPQDYQHLQIRTSSLGNSALGDMVMTFNNDAATNYSSSLLRSQGSVMGAYAYTSAANSNVIFNVGYSTYPSVAIIDIPNYTSTTRYKSYQSFAGQDAVGAGEIDLWCGVWQKMDAIRQVTLSNAGSSTFTSGSTFSLYGIK